MRECVRACGCLAARPVSLGTPAMAGAFASCRAGRYVLIGTYGGSFHALAATDGAVAWTFRAGGDIKAAAVVDPASGLCAVGSYDGHMCAPMGLAGYPDPLRRSTRAPQLCRVCASVRASSFCGTLRVLRVLSRLVLLSEYLRCVAFRRASSCVSGGAGKQPWGRYATSKCSGCSVARRP